LDKKKFIMAAVDSAAKSWDDMSESTMMNDVWKNIRPEFVHYLKTFLQ
jgi:hypothetical protein